jgi:hypothetical protein
MATNRITAMAGAVGLIVVLLGIIPTMTNRMGSNATNTSAYNATEPVATTGAELMPLVVLLLAVGAILSATGLLGGGGFR